MVKTAAPLVILAVVVPTVCAISPTVAVREALFDVDKLTAEDQPFQRYLYSPNNTLDYIAVFTPAIRLHVNLISREAQLAFPKQVVPGLWRVDTREYGWNRQTFENLANIDPYFHRRKTVIEFVDREIVENVEVPYNRPYGYYDAYGHFYQTGTRIEKRTEQQRRTYKVRVRKQAKQLYVPQGAGQLASLSLLTQSEQPIARADWFLVQGARQTSLLNKDNGVGYYDWLQLRDRDDFFRLIGLDRRAAARTEIRAVVGDSKVTIQNREVGRDGATNGGHWFTQEVDDQSGRGVAIQELRDGELNHVAEEHYAPLLNGLPVTFLSDAQGVRQDSVPDKIAGNKSELNIGNDTRVHVNLACMQCHAGQILQPIGDDVRDVYTGRLSVLSNDKDVQLELSRQYGANINRYLAQDRTLYQNAITLATGKKPQEAAQLYSQAFTNYAYGRVTLSQAALELGVTTPQLTRAIKCAAIRLGRGDFRTDPFLLDKPKSIPRLNFEDAYQDLQDALYGILQDQPSVDTGGVGGSQEK